MRYLAQSYQRKRQQKCRPKFRKLSVNVGEAIDATRLRSPLLKDPYFSRVDEQFFDTPIFSRLDTMTKTGIWHQMYKGRAAEVTIS